MASVFSDFVSPERIVLIPLYGLIWRMGGFLGIFLARLVQVSVISGFLSRFSEVGFGFIAIVVLAMEVVYFRGIVAIFRSSLGSV